MKWKDTGESDVEKPDDDTPYYENDGYPGLKDNHMKKSTLLSGIPLRYIFWGLGIAVVLFLILELGSILNGQADQSRIEALESRIEQLENKLQKVDGVDEKVTHIWEQARAFETFKTRFDRSEASMSLRMDHLAMSLDALQKKSNQTIEHLGKLEMASNNQKRHIDRTFAKKQSSLKTHTVAKGETLYSISRKYNLSVEKLIAINKLADGAKIDVGQIIVVSNIGN